MSDDVVTVFGNHSAKRVKQPLKLLQTVRMSWSRNVDKNVGSAFDEKFQLCLDYAVEQIFKSQSFDESVQIIKEC